MDANHGNKYIDSLKFLISKCEDGNSMLSSVGSREESKLCTDVEGSTDTVKDDSGKPVYQDQLLDELTAYAELRGRLHQATLSSDASLLTDAERRLPGGALLGELVSEIDQLGGRLASIGENMEPLGWRLLQNKFTSGLDLPYEQHGAVKSLLSQMSVLIRDINVIELAFQKAATYKPDRKMGDDLTRAVRDLCELRTRLDNIRALRHNCRTVSPADLSTTAASGLGLGVSEPRHSVSYSDNGS